MAAKKSPAFVVSELFILLSLFCLSAGRLDLTPSTLAASESPASEGAVFNQVESLATHTCIQSCRWPWPLTLFRS